MDIHCPEAEVIRLVVDNLNIHNPAALYEVFEPQEAKIQLAVRAFNSRIPSSRIYGILLV